MKRKEQKGRERLGKLLGRAKRDAPSDKPSVEARKPVEEFGRRAGSRPRRAPAVSAEELMLREIVKKATRHTA